MSTKITKNSMHHINATVDDKILHEFRDVIYRKKGLRKGDFQKSLEEAMLEYVIKYSKSEKTKDLAKHVKKEK